jgi:hypothetical protein
MPAVQMPSGEVVDMPDDIDPALGARLRAFHESQQPQPSAANRLANGALGASEILGSGIANIPHAAAAAATDLYRRVTGGDTNAPEPAPVAALHVPLGQAGQHTAAAIASLIPNAVTGGLRSADTALEAASPTLHDVLHQAGGVAEDVGNLIPAAGAVKGVAGIPAEIGAARTAAAEALPAYRTAAESPLARGVAGESGQTALTLHNQALTDVRGNAAAGVPHGTPLSYDTLADARAAPGAVYGRVAQSLPTGPLSPAAAAKIQSAGGAGEGIINGSPDVENTVKSLKTQFLDPARQFSGQDVVANSRNLRQEGYNRLGSEDVSQQSIGKAQLEIANALDQHIADTLPVNAPVTADQFKAARVALAKNQSVQAALRGNSVDAQAIARMQRANPDLLTGELKEVADFANANPTVSTLGSRVYSPPSFAGDVGHALGRNAESVLNPAFWTGITGAQGVARRLLTGSTPKAVAAARAKFPVQLGDAFAPPVPSELQLHPAPGQAFEPHQPDLATGNPQRDFFGHGTGGMTASAPTAPPAAAPSPPGQISLADLLSHGVEQRPAAGLSLAPEGAPAAPAGIPFRPNVEHMAGGLELAPEAGGAGNMSLGDLAHVLSQGVPEGIVSRSKPVKLNKRDMVNMNASDLNAPTLADLLSGAK